MPMGMGWGGEGATSDTSSKLRIRIVSTDCDDLAYDDYNASLNVSPKEL